MLFSIHGILLVSANTKMYICVLDIVPKPNYARVHLCSILYREISIAVHDGSTTGLYCNQHSTYTNT